MFKKMKIGTKLITVGTLILVLPLLVVAVMAITKSTQGLSTVEQEQLAGRSSDIALLIDKVYGEENKLALSLAADPSIIAAAKADAENSALATERPAPVVEKPAAGKVAAGKAA